jgi:hypothetical protein
MTRHSKPSFGNSTFITSDIWATKIWNLAHNFPQKIKNIKSLYTLFPVNFIEKPSFPEAGRRRKHKLHSLLSLSLSK